ncbi:MAG: aldehyde dehydrogenase [Chloroflexi bacterium]|nr:aldehyde dehydrogenase [Chloroflexota bacterium]
MENKLFIGGKWVDGGPLMEVKNKYNDKVIGALPVARREDVDAAIDASQRARDVMADMPAYKRRGKTPPRSASQSSRGEHLSQSGLLLAPGFSGAQ